MFEPRSPQGQVLRSHCCVSIGEAIAAQVLMYCGATAYTWKTAFDVRLRKYSPGVLLVDRITDDLFAAPDIEAINSCSDEAKLYGSVVGGPPNDGRSAGRGRPRENRWPTAWKRVDCSDISDTSQPARPHPERILTPVLEKAGHRVGP